MHQGQADLILPCIVTLSDHLYLVNTRPDINFAVNSLNQFMMDPGRVRWTAAKHILRYIRGTMEYGLVYERKSSVQLAKFTDAD